MTFINSLYARLGKRIRQQRERKNISQEYLSLICRIDRTYLARIEEGKANPTIKILYKISQAFKIKIYELLKGL